MKIPFLKRFRKGDEAAKQTGSGGYQISKPSTISKPEGERLSKTVRPNVTRTVSTEETPEAASLALNEGSFEAPSVAPRAVSFGPTKKAAVGRNKDLPPAVAFALEPRVERAISLDLVDVLKHMPVGLTKPLESLDKSRRILVKASDLERKMATGKPTVSLGSIHHQAPEIFLRPVAPDDLTEIALPFDKVLDAFMQMQVRRDQVSDNAVPQVQTPFLQVTLEDSEKFGVPNEPVPAAVRPPEATTARNIAAAEPEPSVSERFIPIPATAEAIAAANPEAAAATEVVRVPRPQTESEKPLRIPLAKQPEGKRGKASNAAPERIPFHLPPKETGAPASERVPASSGPPVSTPSSATRIPFEMAPGMELPQKPEFIPPTQMNEVGVDDKKISLALKPILQSLPVFELSGDPKEVPDEARIEFSFSLIHSQLSSGRIAIAPELFERALPADGRRFFTAKNLQVPVLLPLQEVLKNLPPDALRMRGDQEEGEVGETIETPFSTAAAEDAKRHSKGPQPITQAEPMLPVTGPEAAPAPAPALDAKSVVRQICALSGVSACSLCFTDGLSLAGNFPADLGADAICAMAPSLVDRIEPHMAGTKIGGLKALTLHCENSTLTFLKHANVCLAALHTNGELTEEVRTELSRLLVELSRTYSPTDTSHVDH